MKKFLLSCFVALGIGATAQITVNESFETTTTTPPTGFTHTGGYSAQAYTLEPSCDGVKAWGANAWGGAATGRTVTLLYTTTASNSKKIDYAFNYLAFPFDGGSINGTMTVSYSVNSTTSYTTLATRTLSGTISNCPVVSGTIAEGVVATGATLRFRIVVTTPNASTNDYYWLVDAFKLTQETTTPPNCTTVTLPSNGANPNNSPAISWTSTPGATSYKVYIGTGSENYDVLNGSSVNSTSYAASGLAANTTYYVKVVPYNLNGDAIGCTESSFTTGALDYCNVRTTADSSLDNISNVTYEGISNSTTITTGSYRDYTSQKATVKREGTKQLSVTIATDPEYPNTDYLSAFIDWNQDKDFNDANERVMMNPSINAGTYTANITVPADAVLGDTRMRVIVEYNNTSTYQPTACNATFSFGEVEDYTVTIEEKETMAVSGIDKAAISVFPNPFSDVLKISDIKGVKSVSVNDVSGREVKSLAPSAELNLSNLKAGLYIVNLKMEDGSVKTFKAIKK